MQTIIHAVIILFIVLGNAAFFIGRSRTNS